MGKKNPINVAASIATQAKRLKSNQVVDIAYEKPNRRVFFDGERLSVLIGTGRLEKLDLSNLSCQPKLALLLATGLVRYAENVSLRSILTTRQNLNGVIATFLKQFPEVLEPSEIDEAFWTELLRFLNAPQPNGNPWTPRTRRGYLQSFKYCITALIGDTRKEDDPFFGEIARHLLHRSGFPYNAWPGSNRKSTPTATLQSHELDLVIETCLGAIEEVRQRLDRDDILLAEAREIIELSHAEAADYKNPYICAAVIQTSFPNQLASRKDISELDTRLGSHVQHIHGVSRIRTILYNSATDLVPFVLLLAAKTAINPDPLCSLSWSDVKRVPQDRIFIDPQKNRSTTDQGEVYEGEAGIPGGLDDILALLRRLTRRTRELVDLTHRDRLFIAAPKMGGSKAKGFCRPMGASSDQAWLTALSSFIETHNLPPFTLKIFRPTAAEIIRESGGDPLDVNRKLKHQHVQTQYTYYTSDRVRRRSRDKLAATQAQLIHWIETKGLVDPRGRNRWDRHSATRGFLCLDPRDSPKAGQKRGRLCTAYGQCPGCPLSCPMPNDDYAVACYLSLRKRINEAKSGSVSGQSWVSKWKHVLTELDMILTGVPSDVLRRASQLCVFMPPIG